MYNTEFGRRLRSQSSGGSTPSSAKGHARSEAPGSSRSDRLLGAGTSSSSAALVSPSSSQRDLSDLTGRKSSSLLRSPSSSSLAAGGNAQQIQTPQAEGSRRRTATAGASSTASGSRSASPTKNRLAATGYVDRFIPQRDGTDLQSAYQLIADEPSTPHRHKRKLTADMDAQKEEANQAFSSLLTSELFGLDAAPHSSPGRGYRANGLGAGPSSSSSSVHTSGGSSTTRHSSQTGGMITPATPTKKNLFTYGSPTRSRTPGRSGSSIGRIADFGIRGSDLATDGGRGGGLFGGIATSGSAPETLDSPGHSAYSLSPVKLESQRMLLSPRKPPRVLNKVPYKVLDAPDLADDFYLNLVDWSSKNVLGVGLGTCVYLWSAETSSVTKLCDLKDQGNDVVTGLNWAGKGNHIAVGTQRGLVQIWDAEKMKLVRTMRGHTQRVGSLAWNEYILSSGSRDRTIFHRDVRAPDQYIRELKAHRQEVCGLKWNVDTNQLASGGNDNRLIVWQGLNETPLHRFTEHTAAVKAIAWSPHQQGILASGGGTVDMKIRFWNTLSGSMLNEIDTGSQICNLMWSKTSNELISTHGYSSGAIQNQIQVWKYPSMQQIATLTGHTMRVLYLAMNPGGDTIVTGAGDETLRFWDLNTQIKGQLDKRREMNAFNPFAKLR